MFVNEIIITNNTSVFAPDLQYLQNNCGHVVRSAAAIRATEYKLNDFAGRQSPRSAQTVEESRFAK
ncbi:MAG TPA: hypothetical protein VEX68_21510, partial [Bryobacteraceae bacterium]|nr:hypothetical protein [Bryobacteraceae bacterium]